MPTPLSDAIEELEALLLFDSFRKHAFDPISNNADDQSAPSHLRQHAIEIIKSAAVTYRKARGAMPGYMGELIEKFIAPPMVPWEEIFESYVTKVLLSKPVRSRARVSKRKAALQRYYQLHGVEDLSRRLPLVPGYGRDATFYVVFVIDTSGSMGTADLGLALGVLQDLQRSGVDLKILVLYIDTSIGKEYELGPQDTIDPDMVGRGGTEFETAFRYVKNLMDGGRHVDLVVYATDGIAPKPVTRLPIPTLWLITPNGSPIMKGEPGHVTLEMKEYPAGALPDAA